MQHHLHPLVLAPFHIRRCAVAPGQIRPPALVVEYMGAGSLRAALARKDSFLLRSDSARIKMALDAARVRGTAPAFCCGGGWGGL